MSRHPGSGLRRLRALPIAPAPSPAIVLAIFLVTLLVVFLGGCNTGSETGNPTKGLSGTLKTRDGLPAARTQVILVPRDFNPLDLVWESPPRLPMDTTDARGRYRFPDAETGLYNLEARSLVDGTRLLLKDVAVSGGADTAAAGILSPPGKLVVAIQNAPDTVNGYVYIPGTTFREKVTTASGSFTFDSLPAGRVDSLVYDNPDGTLGARAIARNLEVKPETTLTAAHPYLAWTRSAEVRLNTTASGARLKGKVAHIPLCIPLAAPHFDFSAARADGSDLRATNARGIPLPVELQLWNPGAGTGRVWVRVDTVFADSIQTLRLHWGYGGKEPVPSAWPQGSVFSLDQDYVAAWHLDEDPFITQGFVLDRSGRTNDATAIGFTAAGGSAEGVIGRAIAFDGATQFVASRKPFDNPGVFTVTAWFKTATAQGGRIFEFANKDASQDPDYWDRLVHMYRDGTINYGVYPPDTPGAPMPTPSKYRILHGPKVNDGQWHHVAVRLSPRGQAFFVDGALVAEDPAITEAQNITGFWRLGYGTLTSWAPAGTSTYFQGAVDEVWIAHAERSEDFIKLSYENQRPGSRLVSFPPATP